MTQTPITLPRDKVRVRRSPVFTKRPLIVDIEDGELAINFHADEPGLFIRDLDADGEQRIRKIGPVHFGSTAPNSTAADYDFPIELSNGECWVDTSAGTGKYLLKTWNQSANSGAGAWMEVGEIYGKTTGYLDQFKDALDGEDYVHTDRARIKINNKTALRGLSTTSGNRLIINENDEFANGVRVNAAQLDVSTDGVSLVSQTMTPFQTESVASNIFTYLAHGLFTGEKVYVYPELADGTTTSPLTSGDYVVVNASNDTFQLSSNGITPVACSGNVYLAPYEEIEIDAEANYFSTGNFAYKSLRFTPADGQIEDGHWDVYHNPVNGNLRIFARAGNTLIEPEGPGLSVEVKNSSGTVAIPAGHPVYIVGYDVIGKVAKVAMAESGEPSTMPAIAVAKEAIAPGSKGYVVFLGRVEGLNTASLPGSNGAGNADEGRVLYVGEDGGLTFTPPPLLLTSKGIQAIAVLLRQDATNGSIVVNNPSAFTGQPPLPQGYVWVGGSDNVATARRLDSNSFQVRTASDNVVELALASNIKFGGYEFLYDGAAGSKVQTKVSTGVISTITFDPVVVASFDSQLYRSAKFLIQVSALAPDDNYEVSEMLIVHNGVSAHLMQYGTVSTLSDPGGFGEFNVEILPGGECQLTFRKHSWIPNNVVVRALRTAILV